jgi:hypothetical protein
LCSDAPSGFGGQDKQNYQMKQSPGKNRDEFMNYIDRVSIFVARHHADQKDVKVLNGILKTIN